MAPRFKVIADYPFSPYKVGQIVGVDSPNNDPVHIEVFKKFTHLFRKLEWYEDRIIEEMSEVRFVKIIATEISFNHGAVCEVLEWGLFPDQGFKYGNEGHPFALLEVLEDSKTHDAGEKIKIHAIHFRPATEAEYNEWRGKK